MPTNYYLFLLNIFLAWSVSALTEFSGSDDKTRKNPGILFDDLVEDDHGDYELSDIIAESKESTAKKIVPTDEQRKKSIDLHNALRRNYTHPFPEASDIPMLEYNNTLEWAAWEYARKCVYAHGMAEIDNMTHEEGQCIYNGVTPDPHRAIYRFYHVEYPSYYFNNHTCMEDAIFGCGHMQQVMMSKTEHMGFHAVGNCWPRIPRFMSFFHYLPGIIEDNTYTIYWKYGPVCSRCKPGYYCSGKLCIPQPERFCKAYNIDCECVRICHNCVKPDWKNCRCNTCKLGWDWPDCSYPCQDREDVMEKSHNCKTKWMQDQCKSMVDQGQKHWNAFLYRTHGCRAACKTCLVVTPDAEPGELCCGGKVCEEFYSLDTDTCECKLLCPSQKCLYPSTTTTTLAPKILLIDTTSPKIWQEPTLKQEDRPVSLAVMTVLKLKMLLIPFSFLLVS